MKLQQRYILYFGLILTSLVLILSKFVLGVRWETVTTGTWLLLLAVIGTAALLLSGIYFYLGRSTIIRIIDLRNYLKSTIEGNSPQLLPDLHQDDLSELRELFLQMVRKMEQSKSQVEENYRKLQLSNLTLEEKYAQAYTLQLIQEVIGRELDSNRLLQKTLDVVIGVFGSKRCSIYIVDENNQFLNLREMTGFNPSLKLEETIALDSDSLLAVAFNEKRVLTNFENNSGVDEVNGFTPDGTLIIPLNGRHSCFGVLVIENEQIRTLNQDLIDFAKLIAQELTLSLENAYLYQKMRQMAIKDCLTGVYNRMYLMNYVNELFGSNPEKVSVTIFDLDHFKMVNDKYGHLAGDMVLKTTAAVVEKILPAGCLLARYGGEEFVALFPGVEPERAEELVETMRQQVAEHEYRSDDGEQIKVTLSAGIAHYPLVSDSYKGLLDLADEALYVAKNSGRNRVCVAKKG